MRAPASLRGRLALWLGLVAGLGVAALSWASDGLMALLGIEPEIRRQAFLYVSRRALVTTWLNARRNGGRVQVRRGHLFDPVEQVAAPHLEIGRAHV